MKVEVWSDIMCPFCYIGKRNYEAALREFSGSDDIELVWKSFQLDPTITTEPGEHINVYEYLASRKGISHAQVAEMHARVTQTAKNAGLAYNLDKAIIANSFDAHRVIQLAKEKGLGDQAEERLFYAHFTEGKDFGDSAVLTALGNDIGLTAADVVHALTDDEYAIRVDNDIQEARAIGVNGVPFFVFDRKYAVSGAQPPHVFLQTLQKVHCEWAEKNSSSLLNVAVGQTCTPGGGCD